MRGVQISKDIIGEIWTVRRERERRGLPPPRPAASPSFLGVISVVEGLLRKEVGGKSGCCVGLMRLVGRNKKIDDIK